MYIAVMRIRNTTQANYVDELHGYLPSSIEVYNTFVDAAERFVRRLNKCVRLFLQLQRV